MALDDERPYNVYGGLQDNGSWRGPSSAWQNGGIRNYHWLEVGGGDGFDVQPHPDDPQVGYSLWQGGNLMRYDLRTGEQRVVKPVDPEGVKLRFTKGALNSVAKQAIAMEREGKGIAEIGPYVAGAKGRVVYETGDLEHGIWSAGTSMGLIHDIPSCKDLVERIVSEAEAIIKDRLAAMAA